MSTCCQNQDPDMNESAPNGQVCGRFGNSLLYKFNNYCFHPRAQEVLLKVDKLLFRADDVLLTMFPKSGSTWLSECIYLIVHQYDYELASKESIELRFPQIDSPSHQVFELIDSHYNNRDVTRLIKASIPPNLLIGDKSPPPRVISVFRNPRDILVSFYHHCKTVKHYDLDFSFDEFYEAFVSGKIPCGPVWQMFNDAYDYHLQNQSTSWVVYYEDMKRNLRGELEKICTFLGKPQPKSEAAWDKLLDHLSVDQMRKNRTINRRDWAELGLKNENGFEFVRKGQVNDWKNFFSSNQSERFDREITEKLNTHLKQRYAAQQF